MLRGLKRLAHACSVRRQSNKLPGSVPRAGSFCFGRCDEMKKNLLIGFTIVPLLLVAATFLTRSARRWIAWPHNDLVRLLITVLSLLVLSWEVFGTFGFENSHKS